MAVPNSDEFMVFLKYSVHEWNIRDEDRSSHTLGVQIMSEMGGGKTRSGFPQYIHVLCQRQSEDVGKKRLRRHSSREIRELAPSLRGTGREGRRIRQVVHSLSLTSEAVVPEVEVDQAVKRHHILRQVTFRPPTPPHTVKHNIKISTQTAEEQQHASPKRKS